MQRSEFLSKCRESLIRETETIFSFENFNYSALTENLVEANENAEKTTDNGKITIVHHIDDGKEAPPHFERNGTETFFMQGFVPVRLSQS